MPVELVERLCRLATWAPNHKKTWPWRFALFTGEGRAELGTTIADALERRRVRRRRRDSRSTGVKYLRAPAMLVVGSAAGEFDLRTVENRDAVAAGVENLLLGATAAGLASFWSSGVPEADAAVAELAGWEDGHVDRRRSIYLGWPDGDGRRPPNARCRTWWSSTTGGRPDCDPMIKVHWFLPTAGDSRDVVASGDDGHRRPPTLEYLAQVARAAEQLGFDAVLTPTGTWCEDAWITTAALLATTTRLRFLVAFRPGSISPTLAAQQAATFQRISGGRLALNVVTGGDPDRDGAVRRRPRPRRRATSGPSEFIAILKGAWSGEPFDLDGRSPDGPRRDGAAAARPGARRVLRRCVAGGRAGRGPHRPTCTSRGASRPTWCAERVERMRELAAAEGRTLRFGIRLHVIARDRAADAWAETDRVLAAMDPEAVARTRRRTSRRRSRSASSAWRRCTAAIPSRLVVAPEPVGRHRPGPRRGRHRAGRLARRGGRAHRGVPRDRLRRVHPVGPPAPRGGVLGGRGRAAARCVAPGWWRRCRRAPWTDEQGRPANLTASAAR